MKKFNFRLQNVLEHRERVETQAITTFAQAKQAVADAESILADLCGLLGELVNTITELRLTGSIDPHEQVAYQGYIKMVKIDIARQESIVEGLKATSDLLRGELVDASQDRKVVNQLREKGVFAHSQNILRIEQEESDELSSARHTFRQAADKAA